MAENLAHGKVCIGFAAPYVALYNNAGGTVTYSQGRRLARGVDVSIDVESADDNVFYADNIAAENVPGIFTSGTLGLTVDGLLIEAEQMIMGMPAPETVSAGGNNSVEVYAFGDAMAVPYVGIGFVIKYMSNGQELYTPVMLTKTRFSTPSTEAATQGETIEWQTQSLEAAIMRDDTAAHNWKKVGADQTTEEAAEAVVKALLNIAEG